MVFTHHSLASWPHSWPEYIEVMGGACDWGNSITTRGVQHPQSGFFPMTPQHITVVDKSHPITQGLGDSFDIIDESYSCPYYEDSVHPAAAHRFQAGGSQSQSQPELEVQQPRRLGEDAPRTARSRTSRWAMGPPRGPTSPIGKLVLNAIKWAASPEALAWAKANPKRIFKSSTN